MADRSELIEGQEETLSSVSVLVDLQPPACHVVWTSPSMDEPTSPTHSQSTGTNLDNQTIDSDATLFMERPLVKKAVTHREGKVARSEWLKMALKKVKHHLKGPQVAANSEFTTLALL